MDDQNLRGGWHIRPTEELMGSLRDELTEPELLLVYKELGRLGSEPDYEERFTNPITGSRLFELAIPVVDGRVCSILYCRFPAKRCLAIVHYFLKQEADPVPADEISIGESKRTEFINRNKVYQS